MTLILYTLFIIASNIFINVQANECNLIEDKSPSLQLFRHLFCDYEASERPTKNPNNATVLNIMLIPKLIEFMDYSNTLQLHAWVYMTWRDEHLQWDEKDFGGVDSIWVESHRIWMPDLAIENAASADSIRLSIPITKCMVSRKGTIVCVPPVAFSTKCNGDYSHWPFDRQNCSVELSLWSYNNNEISFEDNKLNVYMIHYMQNSQWNIVSIDAGFVNKKSRYMTYEEFPTLITYFTLERAQSQLWRVFGTPTLILTVITLTTLRLDPKSNERLLLGCVNFFCHFLCIGNLHWILPNSNGTPNILMFYYNSMILAVVALVLTCLFKKIIDTKDPPPSWLSFSVSLVLSSKVGQILLLSILDPKASVCTDENGDNSNLVNGETSQKSTWTYITIILGWIAFIFYLFTYIIMLAIFLHVPNTIK